MRDLGLRGKQIESREHLNVGIDGTRVRTDGAREPLENSRDLPLFLDLQRAHAVVRFERGKRLDEERLTARARIVHDARQSRGELRFDRNHEADRFGS